MNPDPTKSLPRKYLPSCKILRRFSREIISNFAHWGPITSNHILRVNPAHQPRRSPLPSISRLRAKISPLEGFGPGGSDSTPHPPEKKWAPAISNAAAPLCQTSGDTPPDTTHTHPGEEAGRGAAFLLSVGGAPSQGRGGMREMKKTVEGAGVKKASPQNK